jgi:2-dehydro-3-deoxyphosphooctonate aldolase (KDO 8-P synthase)
MHMTKTIRIGSVNIGGRHPLALIAGPCVIEDRASCLKLAGRLTRLAKEEDIPFIFKASYDKANRSSHTSFRGPGIEQGLAVLDEIKQRFGVPILTDVHGEAEVEPAAHVADVIQIPAFLCRQTDLLLAAGASGVVVNVKKGQFMAPGDMGNVVAKIESTGNRRILLTERGASFGYNNLVADMRSLLIMAETGYPVVFDATHSVQRPGGAGTSSAGDSRWAPALARAAVATGCHAVFLETHLVPADALSDKDNCIAFSKLRKLWKQLTQLNEAVR